jgi:hypothetical protein
VQAELKGRLASTERNGKGMYFDATSSITARYQTRCHPGGKASQGDCEQLALHLMFWARAGVNLLPLHSTKDEAVNIEK